MSLDFQQRKLINDLKAAYPAESATPTEDEFAHYHADEVHEAIDLAIEIVHPRMPADMDEIEQVARAIDPQAWGFIDRHEHDEPPHPAVAITRRAGLAQAARAIIAMAAGRNQGPTDPCLEINARSST